MGKKNKTEDVAADFFGEDGIDWFEDDDDSDESEATLPVAPPPPPPAGTSTVSPLAKDEWADRISSAPDAEMGSTPTLHFSSVPTLPPEKAPDLDEDAGQPTEEIAASAPVEEPPEEPTITEPPPGDAPAEAEAEAEDVGQDPPEDLETEIAPKVDPSVLPTAETEELATEVVEIAAQEQTEDVATKGPARAMVAAGPAVAKATAVSVAPPATRQLEVWTPRGDEEAWRDVAAAMVAEAEVDGNDEQAALLAAAALVHQSRLGDHARAEALYREAEAAGNGGPDVLRGLADALLGQEQRSAAVDTLARSADQLSGSERAEVLLRAADLIRDEDGDRAVELARQATEADADDYTAWSMLRDLLADRADADAERAAVFARLAQLSVGRATADALLARSGLLAESDAAGALDALREASDADPTHGAVFTALEAGLASANEHAERAALYEREAERGSDVGWWHLQSARAHQQAGSADEADAAFVRAAAAGYLFAERERQAAATQAANWEALASSVAQEADALTGSAQAFALYRLGDIRERHLNHREGALAAYRGAVAADETAAPAADAVARALAGLGRHGDLLPLWQKRLEGASESSRIPMHLRMGEVCEASGDQAGAIAHFETAVSSDSAGVALAAAEGLSRCFYRQGDWDSLGKLWAREATRSDDKDRSRSLLFRAATIGPRDGIDGRAAVDRLREVIAVDPAHSGALFELGMRLEAEGDWAGIATLLDEAGDALEEGVACAVAKYRSARVRLERGLDAGAARTSLLAAVEADSTFLPAVWALRSAAVGDDTLQRSLYRTQAEGIDDPTEAAWAWFAASLLAEGGERKADLANILDHQPDHAGALAVMEIQAMIDGDGSSLADLWDGALVGPGSLAKTRRSLALACQLADLDRGDEAAGALRELSEQDDVPDRPLRAAARVAERVGAWDVASALLDKLDHRDDQLDLIRTLTRRPKATAQSLATAKALLDRSDTDPDVAYAAAGVAALAHDQDTLARSYDRMSVTQEHPAARAAAAQWAARLYEEGDRIEQALACWQRALENRPSAGEAFRGVERMLCEVGGVDGLQAVYAAHRSDDALGLALALLRCDEDAVAVAFLRKAIDTQQSTALMLLLEQALTALEDWQGLYEQLVARRERTGAADQQAMIDARRRWVLAEKLAETDTAWDLYRSLHDESPDDREVTEALARIAGARGETALAVQYLKELAASASEPADSARYQLRVGEVFERNDDLASARQGYLDALDHQPDYRDALDGLRRLAEREEDWNGLVQVMQREVDIAEEGRKLTLKREIARVTAERLGDPGVAMDAWRTVLEQEDTDREALEQLMGLAQTQEEWGTYVEMGERLAEQYKGRQRSELLRQVGTACEEHLNRDDAINYYEQAISSETPDIEATQRLEQLFRRKGDWGGVIRALVVRADASTVDAEKVLAFQTAAGIEVETRHDRDSAAEFFRKVLDIEPEHTGALRFMADHLYHGGQHADALPLCVKLEPMIEDGQDLDDFDTRMDLSGFYFAFAEMLLKTSESKDALKRYERALELNPTHLATLEQVGPLYVEQEQWKKAERIYRQLLQLIGGHGDKLKVAAMYAKLGMVERALGNQDKAHKRFNKALELSPNHVDALKGMAAVLEDKKDWSNLLNMFNNIIYHATAPSDVVDAYMKKGRILDEQMTRPDKAAQHYQRSLDFDAKQPVAYLRLAELAMRRDAYDEACDLATKALDLDDENLVEPHRPLLYLCVAAGLKAAAKDEDADARIGDAMSEAGEELSSVLGPALLEDLEGLRRVIQERLPG